MKFQHFLTRFNVFVWLIAFLSLFIVESSRVFQSVTLISLFALNLLLIFFNPSASGLLTQTKKALLFLSVGTFLLYLTQGFYSEHLSYLAERVLIKLPLIFLPLVILFSPPIKSSSYYFILMVFTYAVLAISVVILANYLMQYEYYNQLYLESRVMPGPINHIRYSIIASMAFFLCYYLMQYTKTQQQTFHTRMLQAGMFFLFVFIHVYSVRSGMLALYAVIGYILFTHRAEIFTHKKIRYTLLGVFAATVLLLSQVPTVQNKITNTFNDVKAYQEGSVGHNSLGKRIISYKIAWSIFTQNPWLGCGIGDFEQLNEEQFKTHYKQVDVPIITHNQFLYYLAGTGLLGTLLFTFSFFLPLVLFKQKWPVLLTVHLIILFISFQTEPMLETQLGVAYSVLFWIFPFTKETSESPSV